MGRTALVLGISQGVLASLASAQNELIHFDGTTEFTSRGSFPADPKILLQRIPGDQACGVTQIANVLLFIQDQDASTPESYQLQIRKDDPAMPGQPDMSMTGLIGSSAVIPITFPGAGIVATSVTVTFTPPIPVPTGAPGVPSGDVYVALELPQALLWTGDGISLHMSGGTTGGLGTPPGEQQNVNVPGYSGVLGESGLAWEYNLNPFSGPQGPNATPTLANRAWRMHTRFAEGVTQGFAHNPAVFTGLTYFPGPPPTGGTGANPNFGYAGIWPDMLRVPGPDGIGFRVRATQPAGSSAFLLLGITTQPAPITFPGIGGSLCMVPLFDVILGPLPTTLATAAPVVTSQRSFGPFPGNAAYVGATIHAQGVTVGTNGIIVSSMCTMFL